MKIKSLILLLMLIWIEILSAEVKSPGMKLHAEPDTNKIMDMLIHIDPISENTDHNKLRLDSLQQKSEEIKFHTGVVRALNTKGLFYWVRGDFDNVKECYRQIMSYSTKSEYPFGYFCGLQNMGVLYTRLGNTDSASWYYQAAQESFRESYGEATKAKLYFDIGTLFLSRDELSKCLHNYLIALPYYEKEKDTTVLRQLYNNMGILYNNLESFEKSIDYFKKALEITDSTYMNGYMVTGILNNIGVLYQSVKKDSQTALFYLRRAENLAEMFEIKDLLRTTYSNFGDVYYQNNDYKKSLYYYFNAFNMIDSDVNQSDHAAFLINIGAALQKTGKHNEAKQYVLEGLVKARSAGTLIYQVKAYNNLYEIDSVQGNYVSALVNISKVMALKDSLHILGSRKKIAELEINYEIAEKEMENQYLKTENSLNQQIIKRQQMILLYGVFIIISLAIIFVTIIWSRIHLKRLNKELKLKNEEIIAQQAEIQKQNQILQKLNKTKDRFFGIISHDLKAPFGVFLGFLEILHKNYHEMNEDDRLNIINTLTDTGLNTFQLLENLLNWSLTQRGMIMLNPSKTNLFEQAQSVLESLQQKAINKNQKLLNTIDKDIFVMADPDNINTIMRNILNNALKFTPDGGTIEFSGRQIDGFIEVCISDTGIGIPEKYIHQVFELDNTFKRQGTRQEPGTGLGLILCKEFVEMADGQIYVESEEGKGSRFYFTLPVFRD